MPEDPFLSCSCKSASYQRCTFPSLLNKHSPCLGGPFPAVRQEQEARAHLFLGAAAFPRTEPAQPDSNALLGSSRAHFATMSPCLPRLLLGQQPLGTLHSLSPMETLPLLETGSVHKGLLLAISPCCSVLWLRGCQTQHHPKARDSAPGRPGARGRSFSACVHTYVLHVIYTCELRWFHIVHTCVQFFCLFLAEPFDMTRHP